MNKKRIAYRLLIIVTMMIAVLIPISVSATSYDFEDLGNPNTTKNRLNALLEGNSPKTINIKSDLRIETFLRPGSNTTINAGNHKIVITESNKGAITNVPSKTNYSALTNLTINGGVWSVEGNSSASQSIMRIAHASNVTFNNVKIYDGYEDHAVELIACKNVTFNNCNFLATGNCPSNCKEEQLQIDIADRYTAPGILNEAGAAYVNGAPCTNININSCTVSGARGICANYAGKNAANRKAANYHSKININNCNVTGASSEAVALFNTKSGSVTNSVITTNAPVSRGAYSIGLHVAYMKGTGPKANKKNVINIKNNTVMGGRQAIQVFSHNKKKFGKVVITNNRAYCKKSKKGAIKAKKKVAKKLSVKKNKKYKWY